MKPGFEPQNFDPAMMMIHNLSDGIETSVRDAFLGTMSNFCKDIHDQLYAELSALPWDEKCIMYGRVVNKKARHNLIFMTGVTQEPSYEEGKGRIIDISRLQILPILLESVYKFMNEIGYKIKKEELIIEGNDYYDSNSCYIGFHGDTERKMVMGVRLGNTSFPIHFGWWKKRSFIDQSMKTFLLNPGDAYIMSEKAVGCDWKKYAGELMTLRHAAGNITTLKKNNQWPTE